ncbi:MAG: SigB/SigF/SigG family RNA polymerase sigma factor [Clostridiales bacterium]|jgi:RNA polymerase sporulation-specific sigma factor|nr:SigB/SigF/SigG family RNA polymerase sigma factor [Clostridiales bacterium]
MRTAIFLNIERAKNGDREARSRIVEENTGLVWSVVRRFLGRGHEAEDLFQIGCVGLIKAIQKFDAAFGVQFSTYAVPMIMGEIKRHIRDDGIIKVSRSLKELSARARAARERLAASLGREPTVTELADDLGANRSELVMALDAAVAPESLSAAQSGDGRELLGTLGADGDMAGEVIDRIAIQEALSSLAPRERQIILLRYFRQKTQTQIARMLGISQVQVSRIEKKVLCDMRKKISI